MIAADSIRPVGRQVVLTGGGAELKGIADYAQTVAGPRRAHRPAQGCSAPRPKRIAARRSATLTGLALYAAKDREDLPNRPLAQQRVHRVRAGAMFQRLVTALRAGY